jgi:hypothetical protein
MGRKKARLTTTTTTTADTQRQIVQLRQPIIRCSRIPQYCINVEDLLELWLERNRHVHTGIISGRYVVFLLVRLGADYW